MRLSPFLSSLFLIACVNVIVIFVVVCNERNDKNYNFLDCDWFKKKTPIFPYKFTCQVVIRQVNKPITFEVVA